MSNSRIGPFALRKALAGFAAIYASVCHHSVTGSRAPTDLLFRPRQRAPLDNLAARVSITHVIENEVPSFGTIHGGAFNQTDLPRQEGDCNKGKRFRVVFEGIH